MEKSPALGSEAKKAVWTKSVSKTTKSRSGEYCKKVKEVYERDLTKTNQNIIKYFKWHYQNPDKWFKIINVNGTTGKGSVSVKIASLLQKSGFKVGMYVSPHVSSIRERIQINGESITESNFCKYFDIVGKFEKEVNFQNNLYTCTLSMAIIYFKDNKCDYVILQSGVDGFTFRACHFDSDYAALTSIGFDHSYILGKVKYSYLL